MGLEYSTEDQKRVEAAVAREVEASRQDKSTILRAIHEAVFHLNPPDAEKIARVLARFATLLVNLSDQADKTTQENLRLQSKLVRLTWALFWLTLALALVAAVQIFSMLKI